MSSVSLHTSPTSNITFMLGGDDFDNHDKTQIANSINLLKFYIKQQERIAEEIFLKERLEQERLELERLEQERLELERLDQDMSYNFFMFFKNLLSF